jgi:hypothetical protein
MGYAIRAAQEIFDRAVALQLVPEPKIRRWQTDSSTSSSSPALTGGCAWRMAEGREALRLLSFPRSAGSASRQSGCPSARRLPRPPRGALEDMITGTPTPGESLHPF